MTEGIVLSMILTSHVGWSNTFNEVHPMVSYEVNNYSIGVFRNSLNHTSLYFSKIKNYSDFSVQYGLATNYNNKTVPMLVFRKPVMDHVNLVLVPSVDTKTNQPAMVIGLEARY